MLISHQINVFELSIEINVSGKIFTLLAKTVGPKIILCHTQNMPLLAHLSAFFLHANPFL